jgi:hypothetical protein
MWIKYLLTTMLLFSQTIAVSGTFATRLISLGGLSRAPPAPKKKTFTLLKIFEPQYVQMSVVCGGTIACFKLFQAWTNSYTSRGRLEKALNSVSSVREENSKMQRQIEKLEMSLKDSVSSMRSIMEKRFMEMEGSHEIGYRLDAMERMVRDMEDAYNSSMTKFENFGESLLDETDNRHILLQKKVDADVAALKSALNEMKTQVPKLIRQSDQKMTKIIESYGKKVDRPTKKKQ